MIHNHMSMDVYTSSSIGVIFRTWRFLNCQKISSKVKRCIFKTNIDCLIYVLLSANQYFANIQRRHFCQKKQQNHDLLRDNDLRAQMDFFIMLHTSVFLLYQQTYSFNSYVNCHFSLNSRYDQELKKEKQRIKKIDWCGKQAQVRK